MAKKRPTKTRGPKGTPTPSDLAEKATRRAGKGAQAIPDLPLWNQTARIGGGLTPSKIASIIREADGGDIRRLKDLANECRQRDAHLQAVLSVSEESIAGLPYQVVAPLVPGAKKPRAKDKRAATWVEETLRACTGVHRLIAVLAGAVFYGFTVVEIIWRKEGSKLVPDRFVLVAPRRFRFRREDGQLVWQDDGGPEVDLQATHPNKFILSCPRVNGDVSQREGLDRVLVWMSAMRNWGIGDWLKTGEMSWKPWRIGTYKKGAGTSREDREDLESIMRRLTTDFSAVIPDSCDVKIEWPGGASQTRSSHAEIVNTLANEMSKAVLGQTETTQSSASSGYAQAKVHDAVRKDMRESRARQIAADLTRDLITPMIRLNFGDSVAVPTFEFVTQDPIDLKAFSEAIKNLREAGARVPEEWAHEQAGMPVPKDGERLIGGAIAGEEPEEGEEGSDGEGQGGGDDGDEKPSSEPEDEEPDDPKADDG